MENTQVRFANISIKASDEFMQAVDEQKKYNKGEFLIYQKKKNNILKNAPQDFDSAEMFFVPFERRFVWAGAAVLAQDHCCLSRVLHLTRGAPNLALCNGLDYTQRFFELLLSPAVVCKQQLQW